MNLFRGKKTARNDEPPDDLGLSDGDIQKVRQALQTHFGQQQPTIGVIGVSGTGKSSTINAMFRTTLETSHTRACTKEFRATDMSMQIMKGQPKAIPSSWWSSMRPDWVRDVRIDRFGRTRCDEPLSMLSEQTHEPPT